MGGMPGCSGNLPLILSSKDCPSSLLDGVPVHFILGLSPYFHKSAPLDNATPYARDRPLQDVANDTSTVASGRLSIEPAQSLVVLQRTRRAGDYLRAVSVIMERQFKIWSICSKNAVLDQNVQAKIY